MKYLKNKDSEVKKLRNKWLKKGIELINITNLCELKLGLSGSCNNFNEPDETIHHVQVLYREENIAVINGTGGYVIDEDLYLYWITNKDDITGADFVIYRKVKL